MKRQALDNGNWFDIDSAEMFEEDTYHNGAKHISKATGNQWEHEALYCTKNGKWVLNHWSQWQSARETWKEIDSKTAARWLTLNGKEPHNSCKEEFTALEI